MTRPSEMEKNLTKTVLNGVAGGASAGTAVMIFNPLDTLRIRWQVTPRGAETSMYSFGREIIRNEGLMRGLWRPAILTNGVSIFISSSIRMGIYPKFRQMWMDLFGADEKNALHMMAAGMVAGSIGYLVGTPTYQIKNRIQAQQGLLLDGVYTTGACIGQRPKFRNGIQGLIYISSAEGVPALWRAGSALVVRGGLITMGQMTGYDLTKTIFKERGILKDGPVLQLMGATMAAFCATAASAPADITMTRYQTASDQGRAYKNIIHCVSSMVKNEVHW